MTSNEFILQCREIKDLSSQGQAGLDLDVYHLVNDAVRDVDDAARERAIQILQELAGEKGTVGIISHVNELKEQIEWKLAVTKTEQGSLQQALPVRALEEIVTCTVLGDSIAKGYSSDKANKIDCYGRIVPTIRTMRKTAWTPRASTKKSCPGTR